MEKEKREVISIDSIHMFVDSITSFYNDFRATPKIVIKREVRHVEKNFLSEEEAKTALGNLAKKMMIKKNIVLFGDIYLVSDKISYIDFGRDDDDDEEFRYIKIFFENGDFLMEKIFEHDDVEQYLKEFFEDLKLSKSLETDRYLIVFKKITGFEVGEYEGKPALLIEVNGPDVVPILNNINFHHASLCSFVDLEPVNYS